VADVRVEHEVKLMDFTKWLEWWAGRRPRRATCSGFGRFWGCRFCDDNQRPTELDFQSARKI
jgi:hypothetical protein